MKLIKLKHLVIAFLFVGIVSCSTTPTHIVVSPQVSLSPSNQLSYKETQLTVIDMRTSTHIVQILEKDEAAIILSAKRRLEDTTKAILTEQWQKQGLSFSDSAQNKMTVTIEKAIISVDQESVSYTTQSEIIIKVTIDNSQQTLTSNFKTRASNEGALTADITALEREFNQHLSTLVRQILTSKDIKTFL